MSLFNNKIPKKKAGDNLSYAHYKNGSLIEQSNVSGSTIVACRTF